MKTNETFMSLTSSKRYPHGHIFLKSTSASASSSTVVCYNNINPKSLYILYLTLFVAIKCEEISNLALKMRQHAASYLIPDEPF